MLSRDSTGSTPDVEVVEAPPTMTSGKVYFARCCRSSRMCCPFPSLVLSLRDGDTLASLIAKAHPFFSRVGSAR